MSQEHGPGEGPQALSYEQAREELVEVVRRLEGGAGTLEESLSLWERGELLARVCEDRLAGARRRLEAATSHDPDDGDGEPAPLS